MENLGVGEWFVIGLSVLIGVFFLIGNWLNNQRALRLMSWLRSGLAVFGEVQYARFSAPTAAGMRVKAEPAEGSPLSTLDGMLSLVRRENLPLWLYQAARGRHDHFQFTCDVRPGPRGEVHIFHSSNLSQVEAARRGEKAAFQPLKQQGEYQYFTRGEVDEVEVQRMTDFLAAAPARFMQLSLQRKSPNLTFDARLSPLLASDPEVFFESLRKLIK
jgi:hypothetical protein